MDAIRGLHQLDAEAGALAPGRLRLHQDARRECRSCAPRVDRVRFDGARSPNAESQDNGVQAEQRCAVRDLPTGYLQVVALLLLALGRAGLELAPHPTDAGRLRHRPATLPPDLSARLLIHRAAVLGLLADGYAPAGDTDAGYVLGERLGIADGLGLATHPGSPAWLIAVGESMNERCEIATSVVSSGGGTIDYCDSRSDPGER